MSTEVPGGGQVPDPDEVTAPWWDATRRRVLLVQRCAACGHAQHPPRALCTACGSPRDLGWSEATGDGVVDACTVVERAMPGFRPPYVVARVRLAEGVLLLSNVVAERPHDVGVGDTLRLDWRPLPDGRALPVFVLSQR
ncbi:MULTISPECIES: Zn-ribbon domain-containing OB-fold protein [unclassified Microbispora]|uniref:Zn-ribbon domain-containing OB-fold protein n=1 Tax=unclassified Microbispora TaxID=2614687 RepID=UPI001474ED07|nr:MULTISPECIES: Zn-ribbon domain-containing OB-fold protein [unclassified Microbispora]